MKLKGLTLVVMLLIASGLASAGTTCATATVVPADGRVVDFDFVANGTTNFYQFSVTKDHSYSVEVRQDYDVPNTDLATTSLASENATCTTALSPKEKNTTAVEPAIPQNSFRASFTAQSTGVYSVSVPNTGATGRYVSVSVAETTAFSPQWSTFVGFVTQYLFQNTTSATDINAKLTATATSCAGGVAKPGPVSVNVTVTKGSNLVIALGPGATIDIPAKCSGTMVMSYDGPPGSLLYDSIYAGGANGVTILVPAKFAPTRQSH